MQALTGTVNVKKRKVSLVIAVLVLCAVLCVSAVMSALYVAEHTDHLCSKQHCPVCARLAACTAVLRGFAFYAAAGLILGVFCAVCAAAASSDRKVRVRPTPVSLKVLNLR